MKKTVLITGSTRGIGLAMAEVFAKNKYVVIMTGIEDTPACEKAFKKILRLSPHSACYHFDVSDPQAVAAQLEIIKKKHPSIQVLINNAGITKDKSLLKMTFSDWDEVMRTNLYGPFFMSQQVLPLMIAQNFGRIINTSSIIGQMGNFGQSNYAASKAGLIGFTKSLAKEVAKYNITVNAICPGFTDTDMVRNVPAEIIEKIVSNKIAMRRLAQPKEIAELAFFLASEQAGYITGEALGINGGWL